jgi:hypothetical protein
VSSLLRSWSLARRGKMSWWVGGLIPLGVLGLVAGLLLSHSAPPLLVATFPGGHRLITNERAYYDPRAPGVRISRSWMVTSGSLFSADGAGWTGVPDDISPNALSSNGNDSAVFRVVTRRADFANVSVSFQLRVAGLVSTPRTPAESYDGVHVFLRYQNQRELYVVSVYRRDGVVAIKEKIPGGPVNGGTYYTLSETRASLPLHKWVPVSVSIVTAGSQTVRLKLSINGHEVLASTSSRGRVDPILAPGRIGLRGDNCQFFFRDFTVTPA